MGKVLNSLQLQTFLVMWIIYIADGAPYSKYGRTCKDIGCPPRESCVMAYDTCSFNQQEGTNCGRYPTCQKRMDAQPPQQNSGPSNTPSQPNTNIWNLPTTTTTRYTTTTTRPTTTTTTTRRQWTTKPSFYNPSNPSYGGGGNYFGNRYGDDDPFSSFSRTTSTRRPSSSSSGSSDSFGGFLSGLSSLLSGDVGKLISGALSNRGGSSSGSGGGFFDTRPLIENKGYRGGLFSENTNQGAQGTQTTQTNNYGGYPVTRMNSPSSAPSSSGSSASNPSASHGTYGWKLS